MTTLFRQQQPLAWRLCPQGLEFVENWHYLDLIRTHYAIKIIRHMPQLDTRDRERDNRHKPGPENPSNLYGGLVELRCFGWRLGFLIPKSQVFEFVGLMTTRNLKICLGYLLNFASLKLGLTCQQHKLSQYCNMFWISQTIQVLKRLAYNAAVTGSTWDEKGTTSCVFAKMKKAEPCGAAFASQVRGLREFFIGTLLLHTDS